MEVLSSSLKKFIQYYFQCSRKNCHFMLDSEQNNYHSISEEKHNVSDLISLAGNAVKIVSSVNYGSVLLSVSKT